jgi:DNA-directed RNA polymerase
MYDTESFDPERDRLLNMLDEGTTLEERQAEIEQEAVALGRTRYRAEKPLPWQARDPGRKEEADLAPGKTLLREIVEPIAESIEQFIVEASSGKAGKKHSALPYLANVDPLQAAYLTARHAINGASAGLTLAAIAYNVGDALYEHLEMLRLSKDHGGLYAKLERQLATSTSAKHRLGVLSHVREKYQLASLSWSKREKILLGTKLVELALDATELFNIEQRSVGRKRDPQFLVFRPETVSWLESMHGRCELLSPIHLPMVAPPRDWRTPYSGGYLTDVIRPKLVRTRSRGYLDELGGVDLTRVLSAVNAVQRTPWRINRAVLGVIEEEMSRGGGAVKGLPRENDYPMPPLPVGIPKGLKVKDMTTMQREAMTVWKAEASKVHAKNEANEKDRVILSQKLYVAYRFLDERAIYFPHYLDFRGRIYPMASYLNPQADDVGRAMLEFADGKPLGEDGAFWLAVHIAGLWGIDKVSFDERVAWTHEHEEEIMASALDPQESRFWTTAEKPFQAIAACYDWLGYKLNGNAHVSHLPIAMDGSCSGLQHYSALLRDPVGGAAVNLVPAERPSDIYSMVAERAQALSNGCLGGTDDYMAQAWQGKVCRKVAKQPTMTLCYSATRYGMKGQIEHALHKLDEEHGAYLPEHVDRYKAALYMSNLVWDALGDTVVAARRAMDWLQDVADIAVQAGIPLRWTSPIGLPVLQDYREQTESILKVFVGGKRIRFALKSDSSKLSSRRQGSGVAPNFVHSLDASHLLNTVNLATANGIHHFAMIHDSFGVHAADTTLLNAVLREAFVDQYSQPVLEHFREEIVEQLRMVKPELAEKIPPVPPVGDLDLEAVKQSDFFFA